LRTVLSTIGTFHTFDLARQMEERGALSAIFSGYPRFKLRQQALPEDKVKTFPYLHAPYMRWGNRVGGLRRTWEWQDKLWFDRHVANHMPECDIFCGLSSSGLFSGLRAKSMGAKYVCDRGSSHIRFQERILREEYERQGIAFGGIDPRVIAREEAEYASADVIAVPSTFAFDTFPQFGIPREKMRLIPYGVELHNFYPSAVRSKSEFHILFAGNVTVRKGVHDLVEAFQQLSCESKRLIFAGPISTELKGAVAHWSNDSRMSFLGHLSQPQLRDMMSTSHVMVLPSLEEGLALVQAQALACGCPVLASENTGARDLFTDGKEGFIVPVRDPLAIADRLQLLADNAELHMRMSEAALQRVQANGGWRAYGDRAYQVFSELVGPKVSVNQNPTSELVGHD